MGSSSANELSRETGVHRVSVYDALRGLREKGLISQITRANKFLFEAAHPEKIVEIIEQKEAQLEEAKNIIPDLAITFQMAKEKQEIHSFKGIIGIKTILKQMLLSQTEICDFGAEFKIKEFLSTYYEKWDAERVKKKIPMRIIANKKLQGLQLPLTKIRFIPSQFHSAVSTYLFDEKVALLMWVENPLGLLIEHRAVYDSYKNYFEYLWSTTKE